MELACVTEYHVDYKCIGLIQVSDLGEVKPKSWNFGVKRKLIWMKSEG